MLVNLFVQSTGFQFALSILSVLIFSGLTAWDTQAIKEMYFASDDYEVATKKSVNAALMLYLDFINIFQSLLFLTGSETTDHRTVCKSGPAKAGPFFALIAHCSWPAMNAE